MVRLLSLYFLVHRAHRVFDLESVHVRASEIPAFASIR